MEQYIIKGGNPLVGDVTISGAKNAALGILAASIMTDDDVVIDNLPDVRDINVLLEAIQEIGARVDRIDRHTVKINGWVRFSSGCRATVAVATKPSSFFTLTRS